MFYIDLFFNNLKYDNILNMKATKKTIQPILLLVLLKGFRRGDDVNLQRMLMVKAKLNLNWCINLPRTDTEARADPSITLSGSL